LPHRKSGSGRYKTGVISSNLTHDKFIGKIEKIFQDGIGRLKLKPLDAQAAAWILLGLMYPFFYANPARDVQPGDPVIGLMIDIFLNGIAL